MKYSERDETKSHLSWRYHEYQGIKIWVLQELISLWCRPENNLKVLHEDSMIEWKTNDVSCFMPVNWLGSVTVSDFLAS